MRDYMRTGFEEFAEELDQKAIHQARHSVKPRNDNDHALEEYGVETGDVSELINYYTKDEKNPTRSETGYSIADTYKMKTNNQNDYSTETGESLEFADDRNFREESKLSKESKFKIIPNFFRRNKNKK
jgi:hypothetical protein